MGDLGHVLEARAYPEASRVCMSKPRALRAGSCASETQATSFSPTSRGNIPVSLVCVRSGVLGFDIMDIPSQSLEGNHCSRRPRVELIGGCMLRGM